MGEYLNNFTNEQDQSFINIKLGEIVLELSKRKIYDARVIIPHENSDYSRIIEAFGYKFVIEFNSNHRISSIYSLKSSDNGIDFQDQIWSQKKLLEIVDYIVSVIGETPNYHFSINTK